MLPICESEHNIQVAKLAVDYHVHTDRKPYVPNPIRVHSPAAFAADLGIASEVQDGCGFVSHTLFQSTPDLSAYDCYFDYTTYCTYP